MIQKPRGTRDLFKNNLKEYQQVEKIITSILDNYNFTEIRTPILEMEELFVRSVGDNTDVVSKEMYTLNDRKNRKLVLRPEGTASVVRSVIENKLYIPEHLPLKLFYHGPMFRYERPQIGRSRQFDQIGVEIFGKKSPYQDLELMSLIKSLIEHFHLENNVQLDINYLTTGEKREKYIDSLRKYLKNFDSLCQDCLKRLDKNPLRILECKIDGNSFQDAPDIYQYASDTEKEYFSQFQEGLKNLTFNFQINKQLVRGLDYYTGIIFELKYLDSKLGSQSTILAGGRYDNLVSSLGGPELDAIGFAIGLDRFVLTLKYLNFFVQPPINIEVFTVPLNKKALSFNLKLVKRLRENNIKTESDLTLKGMKHVFKEIERKKIKYLIVLGDKEIKTNKVILKNWEKQTIQEVHLNDLINIIRGE